MVGIKAKTEEGISLYLAVLVMVILLAVVLGLSTILFGQIRMIGGMEDSVIAFCAADTGIEYILFEGENASTSENYSDSLSNGATWIGKVVNPGASEGGVECPADIDNFCIHVRGTYNNSRRAIQISR